MQGYNALIYRFNYTILCHILCIIVRDVVTVPPIIGTNVTMTGANSTMLRANVTTLRAKVTMKGANVNMRVLSYNDNVVI